MKREKDEEQESPFESENDEDEDLFKTKFEKYFFGILLGKLESKLPINNRMFRLRVNLCLVMKKLINNRNKKYKKMKLFKNRKLKCNYLAQNLKKKACRTNNSFSMSTKKTFNDQHIYYPK